MEGRGSIEGHPDDCKEKTETLGFVRSLESLEDAFRNQKLAGAIVIGVLRPNLRRDRGHLTRLSNHALLRQ